MAPMTRGLALAGVLAAVLVVSTGARAVPNRNLLDAFCTPQEELDFLLTFKSARNFNPGTSMSTWDAGTDMCVDWSGVACDDGGHVTALNLRKEGIDGSLPDGFSCFEQLATLTLGGNDFTGNLPSAWGSMPSLTRIRLKNSELVGSLPVAWSMLGEMKAIAVSNNDLSGEVPEEWAQSMLDLKVLMAKKNMFSGTIPAAFGEIESLERVTLQENNLQGDSPFDDGDVDLIFGPQNTPAPTPAATPEPTEPAAPRPYCVYQNENWSMAPRPNVGAPGYYANFLGLVQCFIHCDTVDIIVWNENSQYCQCWNVEDGFTTYTGEEAGDTTFILAFCDEPESGDAKNIAAEVPDDIQGSTRTSPVPSYPLKMFEQALMSGFSG